ncbi:MAG: BCCT family transporter [Legionellaceae bacterium]|nr:BCCT family transporter [Legionellaceae bacterium]
MPHTKQSAVTSSVNKRVLFSTLILISTLMLAIALFPEQSRQVFLQLQDDIIQQFGWLYMLSVAAFICFCLFFAISPCGLIKLGSDNSEPDYSYLSWFAMLFSAGMGIGLLFFSVAEPLIHYIHPPLGEPATIQAAQQAMIITFFHWGIHAWAIYALLGLALAYFGFRHHLPLTIRSTLYPLLGKWTHGICGDIIDVLAVIATMIGLATSLGLGVMQINEGLRYVFGFPDSETMQILIIIVVTGVASFSVFLGLNAGIRRLSLLNILLALSLLIFVFFAGPTLKLPQLLVQNIGNYLSNLVHATFNLYAYQQNNDWLASWTLFYWGWWISWSPFVGMFIARISRGRTIRDFILGVLFIPVGFTFIWMTVFGNTALFYEQLTPGLLSASVTQQLEIAAFKLYEQLPLTMIASTLTIIVSTVFFITSLDSGALVIDIIISDGKIKAHWYRRVVWTVMIALIAIFLLFAGGLVALQTAAMTSALPFVFVILAIGYSLLKSLRAEMKGKTCQDTPLVCSTNDHPARSWPSILKSLFSYPNKTQAKRFLTETVRPALEKAGREFEKKGLRANLSSKPMQLTLDVVHQDIENFTYTIRLKSRLTPSFIVNAASGKKRGSSTYYQVQVLVPEGVQQYNAYGYTEGELLQDIFYQYEKYIIF